MHFPTPETDLRGFRLSRINEPQYRHLWWLLFWPAYLLRYFLVEHWNPAQTYHVMHRPFWRWRQKLSSAVE